MAWLVIADQELALKSSLSSEGLTQCRPCRCVWREEKGSVGFLFWNVSSSTKTHSDLEYSLPPFSPKCFITLPVSLMILPMLCLIKLNCWGSSYKAETVNLVCWRQAVQGMTKIYITQYCSAWRLNPEKEWLQRLRKISLTVVMRDSFSLIVSIFVLFYVKVPDTL